MYRISDSTNRKRIVYSVRDTKSFKLYEDATDYQWRLKMNIPKNMPGG
jgi:hypothetical protein